MMLYIVSIENTYDIIKRTHQATVHSGRDGMLIEIEKMYANIAYYDLQLFMSLLPGVPKKKTVYDERCCGSSNSFA